MSKFEMLSDSAIHRVRVTVDKSDVDAALEDAARGIQAVMTLPPHPKGQVPLDIILSKFAGQLRSGVTEKLVRKATGEAVYSLGLRSGAEPQLDEEYKIRPDKRWLGKFTDSGSLEFSVSWPRPADVEIRDYIGIQVEISEGSRDEAIANQLLVLQLQTSSNKLVDREANEQDVIVVDLTGADESGTPIHGARFTDFVFRPKMKGARQFGDQLSNLVVGHKAGDVLSFEEEFKEDHHDRYLRGKKVHFSCTIKEVRESVVPEIDDEFAKIAGMESLDALKTAIGNEWDRRNAQNIEDQKRVQVRKKLVEANPLPVDDKELQAHCIDAANQYGVKYDQLNATPEMEHLADLIKNDAREVIVFNELLDRIYDKHSVELCLTESDVLAYAAKDAQVGVTAEEEIAAKKSRPAAYAAWLQRTQRQKVADWLTEKAVVVKTRSDAEQEKGT